MTMNAIGQVPEGTRYRFLLNDDIEVLDPAIRAVQDGGNLQTAFAESPSDGKTSWSVAVDVESLHATAHTQPWQTMAWSKLLIYEMHVRRLTDLRVRAYS
jgi:1,4-alpha-glucan branching enzyme